MFKFRKLLSDQCTISATALLYKETLRKFNSFLNEVFLTRNH